jgi:hypothetical protein
MLNTTGSYCTLVEMLTNTVHIQKEGLVAGHLKNLPGLRTGLLVDVHKQQRHLLSGMNQNL